MVCWTELPGIPVSSQPRTVTIALHMALMLVGVRVPAETTPSAVSGILSISRQPVCRDRGACSKVVEVLMPSYKAGETPDRPFVSTPALLMLSAIDRARIELLVGHTLARVERELILQTLRCLHGNRTHAADRLGISVRSLRDRLRNYRGRGECVPDPGDSGQKHLTPQIS